MTLAVGPIMDHCEVKKFWSAKQMTRRILAVVLLILGAGLLVIQRVLSAATPLWIDALLIGSSGVLVLSACIVDAQSSGND